MAIKHNQQIPNNHFRKQWQTRVRTHFDQPGRKLRRRDARITKAAAVAPRPVDKLRPVVRCPTIKYNRRVRAGRGFTLEELKAAKIAPAFARTIGISVDHRRVNHSVPTFTANVERLQAYSSKLILFPRKVGKPKKGDSSAEDLAAAAQTVITSTFPIAPYADAVTERKITAEEKNAPSKYRELRTARSNHRQAGKRAKRQAEKADAEAAAKK
ncbi:ribosomal protein L13e [Terfezia boudieri ATCC MYA-4762]|uniref:Ribosomal protein L13e n=1 Tax=Terfezia boudieri ATCC MYA-4762 TaxID=1051890 RepID=A0A3N4LDC7_9PEZI|nr:ribosomal protein L13e [Terfezia boudieri ATCC MYA-4762]